MLTNTSVGTAAFTKLRELKILLNWYINIVSNTTYIWIANVGYIYEDVFYSTVVVAYVGVEWYISVK